MTSFSPSATDERTAKTEIPDFKGEFGGDSADLRLVEQTRRQIRGIVQEITQLTQSDISVERFFDEFTPRVVSALAAVGGAVYTCDEAGVLRCRYQANAPQVLAEQDAATRHSLLLKQTLRDKQSKLLGPQTGTPGDDEAGNPTDYLLILAPIVVDQQAHGVVEIFQRPGGGPTTQRGYARFLQQMCDLVAEFLRNQRLQHLENRQVLWQQLESFLGAIHESLDLQQTVLTIANEGRLLIGCDRVTVALKKGKQLQVEAVSGLDGFDRRASQILSLGKLARAVAKAKEPLWFAGSQTDLPPQIESALSEYVDLSHARSIAVLPLAQTTGEEETGEVFGVLIAEQLHDADFDSALRGRVETVARHSTKAIANSLKHHRIFLRPLWQTLGEASWLTRARTLPKTMLAAGLLVLFIFVMLLPYDFEVSSPGKLRPQLRRAIFAPQKGVVLDVPVDHGDWVKKGDVVVQLADTDLEVEITTLQGRRTTTNERLLAIQRTLIENNRLSLEEENRLSGELLELKETAASIEQQLALLNEKSRELLVRAPQDGQIITWQVREKVLRRPVQRGQQLMTVVAPDGPWELELQVPERRMGHLLAARGKLQEKPQFVRFQLATHPGEEFEGQVMEIDNAAGMHPQEGNSVRVRVAVDRDKLPDLREGAQVEANISCGRRPLGYVLFHDIWEAIQTHVLFRL